MLMQLNKTSTRYYWDRFLGQKNIPRALFFDEELDEQEKLELFKRFVCIVNIETSSYCNRRCGYCPVSLDNTRTKQIYMAHELFAKLMVELTSIEYSSTIVFNLYNEPLVDESIVQRVAQTRDYLPHAFLMFNSNGDYVTADKLTKLNKAGLNALFVTLHPSHKQNYAIGDRLRHFKKFFKQIGISQYKLTEPLENGHIESNIDWNGTRIRVMANDWTKYGVSRAGAMCFLNSAEPRISPCARPLRELTISYDGNVFPCCQFYPDSLENQKYIVANISFNSIFEIYASRMLTQWREKLFPFGQKTPPCDSCMDEDFSQEDSLEIRERHLAQWRSGKCYAR